MPRPRPKPVAAKRKGRAAGARARVPTYDPELAGRIRDVLAGKRQITEKEMFGGVAFLVRGKMFCGIAKGDLMVRVGPELYEAALAEPHVRPMDFTGRPLRGYVFVAPAGLRAARLTKWVTRGFDFTSRLAR